MSTDHTALEAAIRTLAHTVCQTLRASGLTCATAESCTGGLVGHLLTEVPGSSACFAGGAVTYSNEAKHRILGVDMDLLCRKGAVSPEVAAAMAQGACVLYETDMAVSITGVAGPDGGTPDKPVGLVYLHLATRSRAGQGLRHVWPADRSGNKLLSAQAALQLLRDHAQAA